MKRSPKKSKASVLDREHSVHALLERVSDSFFSLDKDFRFTYVNQRGADLAKRDRQSLLGQNIWKEFPELVDTPIYQQYHRAITEQRNVDFEFHYQEFDVWAEHHIYPSPDGLSIFVRDITEAKRIQRVSAFEKNVLEFYTSNTASLEETLHYILNGIREIHPDMLCSVLTVKDNRLYTLVSPHLPKEFNATIDGLPVEAGVGSCGTAAFIKDKVFVTDILTDPLTKDYRDLARKFDLQSCWSYPIITKNQKVLGTLAVYYKEIRNHTPAEELTLERASNILRNILDYEFAHEALRKSEQVRRLIMNSALDAIICMDTSGAITLWNPAAEKIFGWREEEVLGKPIADIIIAAKYREQLKRGMEQYLKSGKDSMLNKLLELTALHRNGNEFPISIVVVPVKQDSSEFMCAFIEDLTERVTSQSQLQKANEQLVTAQRIARLGYWELDLLNPANNYWSDQIFEICGIENSGEPPSLDFFLEMIHPDDREELIKNYYSALNGTHFFKPEYRLIRESGSLRYVLVEASRICNDQGVPIRLQGTIQDITKLKENELKLIQLNEELNKRADELVRSNADLEQFAYVASHDLQEPLRMVTGFLTQIEKRYQHVLDEQGKQFIYFAVDGADRMKRIILDLLEYSRIGRSDAEVRNVNMNDLISEIVELNKATTEEKNAVITWQNLPTVRFSKTAIQMVMQNLIGNALKYQKPDRQPQIEITAKDNDTHWQFSVLDNGIGIDPKHFDKIFVLFKRLHSREAYSGSGLGLAICKKIIETYNGKIWVESMPEKGSIFSFTISKETG